MWHLWFRTRRVTYNALYISLSAFSSLLFLFSSIFFILFSCICFLSFFPFYLFSFCGCVTICHFNYLLRHQDASLTCIFVFLAGKYAKRNTHVSRTWESSHVYEYIVQPNHLVQSFLNFILDDVTSIFLQLPLLKWSSVVFSVFISSAYEMCWSGLSVCVKSLVCLSWLLHVGRKVEKLWHYTNTSLITILVPGYLAWKRYNM